MKKITKITIHFEDSEGNLDIIPTQTESVLINQYFGIKKLANKPWVQYEHNDKKITTIIVSPNSINHVIHDAFAELDFENLLND